MGTLESRVEKLEQSLPQELKTIFIVLVALGKDDVPVLGWRFNDEQRQWQTIMLLPGESESDLRERAGSAARLARPGCNVILYPVTDCEKVGAHDAVAF